MMAGALGNSLQSNVSTTTLAAGAPKEHVAATLAVGSICDSAGSIIGPLVTLLYRSSAELPAYVMTACSWTSALILIAVNAKWGKQLRESASTASSGDGKPQLDWESIVLGEPSFDAKALVPVLFKGKAGVDFNDSFASDLVELSETLYLSYKRNNHLQAFKHSIARQREGSSELHRRVLLTHKELIERHLPYLHDSSTDHALFIQEIEEMLTDLGHDDWATNLKDHATLMLKVVPNSTGNAHYPPSSRSHRPARQRGNGEDMVKE